ncbi:alpha/beta fold hydrolase [Bradyrhizobium sp. sBnM-33]|uniref:alpha/beta fold hydrolase n=1 Tax=Bradyrhizobium sp. sBnM-33 TaxID=2831780 RepID=UPI001BCBA3E5|nr:alpha/beta fold hydrolase [Bradyrhizobium sp. sBnM-33]WOH53358.1 alpha/beta fold hydrolase [Bradyrhizobium sp. sBnM-33]
MAEFVLIHGAWHGAWCWDDLIPALASYGHAAHVLDLPGLGDDRTAASEVSLDACASRVADRINRIGRPVWLLGHSMGGVVTTQAAEKVADRIEALVYLAAFVPPNGQSLLDLASQDADSRLNQVMVLDQEKGTASVPNEHLRECFYSSCSEEAVRKAVSHLRREQPGLPAATPVSLGDLSAAALPRYYIECLQDRAISIGAQRRMHQNGRVRYVSTLDTDHSPFLSRPNELAGALDGFVASQAGRSARKH